MRDSFIFYKSFWDAIKLLPSMQRDQVIFAIMEYVLNGTDSDSMEMESIPKAIFTLIKPQLDANNKRYENGRNGGRPTSKGSSNKNQNKTKTKPKRNQTITKTKANDNDNDNDNDNVNVNDIITVSSDKSSDTVCRQTCNDVLSTDAKKSNIKKEVADWWNGVASFYGLACIKDISKARFSRLKARINQAGGLVEFEKAIDCAIENSRFLRGTKEGVDWKPDFDFFLQEKSFIKAWEGSYADADTEEEN